MTRKRRSEIESNIVPTEKTPQKTLYQIVSEIKVTPPSENARPRIVDPADAYAERASVHYNKGEFDQAIANYTEAITADSKRVRAYKERGWAYYEKGEFDKAIADFTELITLDPKHAADYHYIRGCILHEKGEHDKAVDDYTAAFKLQPAVPYGEALNEAQYLVNVENIEKKAAERNLVYYKWTLSTIGIDAYGSSKEQIIEAFKDLKRKHIKPDVVKVPTPDEIVETNKIYIGFVFPISSNKFITIDLGGSIFLDIHPEAYGFVQESLKKHHIMGELHELYSGCESSGFYYVPSIVIEKALSYDWEQHSEEVNEYCAKSKARLLGAVLNSPVDESVLDRFEKKPRTNGHGR